MTPKLIKVQTCYFDLMGSANYSPEDLRNIADQLEEDGVQSISFIFDAGYNNVEITECADRLETPHEIKARLAKEHAEQAKIKADRLKKIQKVCSEAQHLGIKTVPVDPVETAYVNIFWVTEGTNIQGFIADKVGYVWYTEDGNLWTKKVYESIESARQAFLEYFSE